MITIIVLEIATLVFNIKIFCLALELPDKHELDNQILLNTLSSSLSIFQVNNNLIRASFFYIYRNQIRNPLPLFQDIQAINMVYHMLNYRVFILFINNHNKYHS